MIQRTRVAAYALVVDDGRLLLCRLTDGRWTLPGGGLEFGEAPEDGAVREVREETGLDARPTGLAGVDSELAFEGTMHGIRVVYRAEVLGGELRDEIGGATDRAAFFSTVEARALPLVSLAEYGLSLVEPLSPPGPEPLNPTPEGSQRVAGGRRPSERATLAPDPGGVAETGFTIRPLGPADAEAYWAIRLEALESDPLAFGSSAEETRAAGFEAVTARHLRDVPDGNFMLGAFLDGRIVGLLGFLRPERGKDRHRGMMVSMFVRPEARGRGLGRALVAALLERVRGYEGLEWVALSVAVHASAARSLYRAMGFVPYGLERHGLKVGDDYADMELMALDLRPA